MLLQVYQINTMLSGSFPGDLVIPSRHFVHVGELHKISRKAVQKRWFFLFNDILLYARGNMTITRDKIRGLIMDEDQRVEYRGHIDLSTAWVRRLPPNKTLMNAFQVITPSKTYTMFAKDSCRASEEWCAHLERAIEVLVKDRPDLVKKRGCVYTGLPCLPCPPSLVRRSPLTLHRPPPMLPSSPLPPPRALADPPAPSSPRASTACSP